VLANHLKAAVTTTPVRRLCPHCRRQAAPRDEMLARLGLMREEVGRAFVAGECDRCAGVGYLGVIGCSSLMLMDRELAAALRGGVGRAQLAAAVAQAGGRPLLQVGLDMVRDGLTSLEELARCLPQ
jgi:type II secretory ATPase GspE/PulE/Tfp pilus assembly ATPase PilB-like protein